MGPKMMPVKTKPTMPGFLSFADNSGAAKAVSIKIAKTRTGSLAGKGKGIFEYSYLVIISSIITCYCLSVIIFKATLENLV